MQMTGYTKLFGSIVASTIWREPPSLCKVWITMLAVANKNGVVEAAIPGLADLARVTIEETETALANFMAPDKYSRTKDFDGRRIAEVDGGWQILNHAKYRAKMNADERRGYLRVKQQESRARRVNTESTIVNNGQRKSTPSTHAEAEAVGSKEPAALPREKKVKLPHPDHGQFISDWMTYFAARNKGEAYPFGPRDAKAAQTLLRHFETIAKTKEFIKAVHKRSKNGFPFTNAETLYDIANNIARLTAALGQPAKNGTQAAAARPLEGVRMV